MKKLLVILPLALILCFMAGCQDKEAMADTESEKWKVQTVLNQYARAWKNEDIELLAKIFSQDDDMVIFDGNIAKPFVGWEAWKERLQKHFESYEDVDISFRDVVIKVHASGNMAWLSCVMDVNCIYQNQQSSIEGLRVTWALEKQDGTWVIVQAHFSFPREE